jgi:hypothetical protein
MWFGQMNTDGANAATRNTCNHSPEWDKHDFKLLETHAIVSERWSLTKFAQSIDLDAYVMLPVSRVYRSEHRSLRDSKDTQR